MQHGKVQACQRVMFATLGHVAHLMGNQAADGVEGFCRFRRCQRHAKGVVNPLDGRVAADAVGAVGQREDVALVFGNVKLVLNLANNLFQHVFNGDDAGHAAKFVDHHRQVVAVAAKLAQQVVQALAFGHKHGRAQQGAEVEPRRALQLEQVFGHQDANDVFPLTLIHRKARVRGVNHGVQQGIERGVDVEQVHPGGCHHHIPGAQIGHADDALQHGAGLGPNDVVVLRLDQRLNQLGLGIGAGIDELGQFLEKSALVFFVRRGTGQSRGLGV